MAMGAGPVGGTLGAGQDAIYLYSCTPCSSRNLNTEALSYCKDCGKQFCNECLQYHNKVLDWHRVLGKDAVQNWGEVKHVTANVMCDDHPGKELEMFCADHDCLCCHICVNINHR